MYQYNGLYKNLIKQQTAQDLAAGERINYQYDAQMNNYQNRINQNDFQLGLGAMAYANKGTDFAIYNAITQQQLYRPQAMTVQQAKAKDAASRYKFQGEVPVGYEDVLLRPQNYPTYTNEVQILTPQYQYPQIAQQVVNNMEAGSLYENQYGFEKILQQQKNQIFQNMINSYQIQGKQNSQQAMEQYRQVKQPSQTRRNKVNKVMRQIN